VRESGTHRGSRIDQKGNIDLKEVLESIIKKVLSLEKAEWEGCIQKGEHSFRDAVI